MESDERTSLAAVGIKHLSPSAINLYTECPCLWAVKYLLGVKDDESPAAWRGKAVEAGLHRWLVRGDASDAEDHALAVYQSCLQESAGTALPEKIADEYDNVLPMLDEAIKCFDMPTPPDGTQFRVEAWLDDVPVPVVGYCDFLWSDRIFELKTTKAVPREPRSAHMRQIALYWQAKGNHSIEIAYCSGKKHAVYNPPVESLSASLASLRRDALALCRFVAMVSRDTGDAKKVARAALDVLPMQEDHLFWSDVTLEAARNYIRND